MIILAYLKYYKLKNISPSMKKQYATLLILAMAYHSYAKENKNVSNMQINISNVNNDIKEETPIYLTIKDFQRLINSNEYSTAKSELINKGWKLELETTPDKENQFYYSEFSILQDSSFTYIKLHCGTDPKYHNDLSIDLMTSSKNVFDKLYLPIKALKTQGKISISNGNNDFDEIFLTSDFGYGFRYMQYTNIKKPVWSFKIKKDDIEKIDFNNNIESFETLKVDFELTF